MAKKPSKKAPKKPTQSKVSDDRKVDLADLYADRRDELNAKLKVVRRHATHEGAKGDAAEKHWIGVLSKFLPKRYVVQQAFVIDSMGHCSHQEDIVIFDSQYCPLILHSEGLTYVPAESVYAVIEAKQDFNKQNLLYAATKAESVRKLLRTSIPIVHAGGEYPAKPLFHIPAGIVTLDASWSGAFGAPFEKTIKDLAHDRQIEFGCVLGHGAFNVEYRPGHDPVIQTVSKHGALMFFLLTLFRRLQALGTVAAIDVQAYSKWIT